MVDLKHGFVNICTLFDEKTSRTVAALQQLYNDKALLLSAIDSLAGNTLNEDKIKDKRILLKPNWVKHPFQPWDNICLCTHDKFILSVLEYVLLKKPASVLIGDAPIQGCEWDRMVSKEFLNDVRLLSEKYNVPVTIKDFRRVVFDSVANKVELEKSPMSEYIIFDVGKKSFLEPITVPQKNLFRVAQYDPDKFTSTHKPGMHKYCITKELFDADIVISLPKVKTHHKAAITCALKNIVGFNGDKDYLPHHRIGGVKMGGDSYAGKNRLRYWAELALDNANRRKGKSSYWPWIRLSSLLWKISFPGKQHQLNAAWSGNDTTWRMVMDLNTIVMYGKKDGTLGDTPQRLLYSFCDGIVGGEGEGPLRPEPLNLGVLSFTDDSSSNDICMAALMNLKAEKIPLLVAAKSFMPGRDVSINLNGNKVSIDALKTLAVTAKLPAGWEGY